MKRCIPDGSNEQKPSPISVFQKNPSNIKKLYEFGIKRRVSDGSNKQELPSTLVSKNICQL